MAEVALKELIGLRKAAGQEKAAFQPLLDEVYTYVTPYRRGISQSGAGDKRVNQIFDHTAILSTFRSASRIAQDISPPGQQNFKLVPGAWAKIAMDEAQLENFKNEIELLTVKINAHFTTGEWDQALAEMAIDLMGGTGAMLIIGDKRTRMSRFISVPIEEIMLRSGPYNEVDGIFWQKEWTISALVREFGEQKIPRGLLEKLENEPGAKIKLNQDTVFNASNDTWEMVSWIADKDEAKKGAEAEGTELRRAKFRACPWLTPRYFRVPGETYGRGPVMMVMPTVKALNTATKLNLQAAAIAMLGIYTAVDDGVFNPSNSPITPGAFWKVARNGGVMGPSVQRFPDPRVDLSQIILKDFRLDVQSGLGDQSLPPDTAGAKSATEIMERVKRIADDHQGAFGRLVMEIAVPAVKRVMEIAYEFRQCSDKITLDRALADLQVSSPMAMAREAEVQQRILQYIQIAMSLAPQTPQRYVNLDKVMPDLAQSMAVPSRFIPTDEERQQQDKAAAAEQAAALAAQMALQNPEQAQAMADQMGGEQDAAPLMMGGGA